MAKKTPNNDLLFHAGHRERLKQKFLDGHTSSADMLELLLMYAIPRRDVRPVARALLQRFGNVYFVLHAPVEDLLSVPGIGRGVALIIKLFRELTTVSYLEEAKETRFLGNEKFIRDLCRELVAGHTVEEAFVLYLDENFRLLASEMHSRGTINETGFYPREICKRAITLNATSVIMLHNHPTSENSFSNQDLIITSEVESVLKSNQISLLDHLVVLSNATVHSSREMALLDRSSKPSDDQKSQEDKK